MFRLQKNLSFEDPDLEAKLFPHLFPYGMGSWQRMKGGITLGAYTKMRLKHADRRWANDRYYLYFTFDRLIKERIMFSNFVLATNRNRDKPLNAGQIKESYYNYGTLMPAEVAGSKAYMRKNGFSW